MKVLSRGRKKCKICGEEGPLISELLGVCIKCLREMPEESLRITFRAHKLSRERYGLPPEPPKSPNGIECGLCANRCRIGEGEYGFCGLVKNEKGKLVRYAGTPERGLLKWYYDALPTNCVAEWVCPGCTGRGYPQYAYLPKAEVGYYNLAVFYGACNLDCLFCQNWHYRELAKSLSPLMSAKELAGKVHDKVSCVCFFGGDPSPQMPHALASSKIMREKADNRILRICWETNGIMNKELLKEAVELSLESGGCIKFDVKAWDRNIYKALTGVDNKPVFENIKLAAKRLSERDEPPLIIISTLLVPGYVDEEEVRQIARFIADIDPNIPYSLLAFHPEYLMIDLPPTSRRHALRCLEAAREEGLKNVIIGNIWLLGDYY